MITIEGNMDSTWEALNRIFQDVFDNEQLRVQKTTTASDIEGWDSLAHVSLIVAIERQFKIKFRLGEIQDLKNVGEMIELIQQKSK